jgi:hypothetical protein
MTFSTNITPDYEDPQWVERVDDWEEFWYSTEDEELDADEDLSPAERSEQSLERARKCSRPAPGFTTLCPPFMTLLRTSRQATGAARQNSSILAAVILRQRQLAIEHTVLEANSLMMWKSLTGCCVNRTQQMHWW